MTQLLIILIIILYNLIRINYSLILSMLERNTNLYQYKINHFIWSHFFFISPIFFLIGFFYLVWIYKIIFVLDLKDLDIIIYIYNQLFFMDSLWFVYFLLLVNLIFLTLLLVVSLICLFKYYLCNCIKLFIYYCHPCLFKGDCLGKWHSFLSKIARDLFYRPVFNNGFRDLFSHIIYKISWKLILLLYGKEYSLQMSKKHPHAVLAIFLSSNNRTRSLLITMSPLFFILYDCIYNNYVITHVFYYLIIYIPVILLKRVSIFNMCNLSFLCEALWRIYYSKRRLLFAIPPEGKPVLDYCLAFRLERNLELGLDMDEHMYYTIVFFPSGDNLFHNENSVTVMLAGDGQVYEAIFDDNCNVSLGNKWVLLAYKDH